MFDFERKHGPFCTEFILFICRKLKFRTTSLLNCAGLPVAVAGMQD
jgi:hypothetical protein